MYGLLLLFLRLIREFVFFVRSATLCVSELHRRKKKRKIGKAKTRFLRFSADLLKSEVTKEDKIILFVTTILLFMGVDDGRVLLVMMVPKIKVNGDDDDDSNVG